MKVNDFFDKVVVINLDRREDRLEKISKQLTELGIEYERFSAVDGLLSGISPIEATRLSHVSVWGKYKDSKVLILEDDALFCSGFKDMFSNSMLSLPEDWDVLYLGGLIGEAYEVNESWNKLGHISGLHAYCINPNIIKDVIKDLAEYKWHVDIGLIKSTKGLNSYISNPNLVTQFPSFSDIRLKEVDDF